MVGECIALAIVAAISSHAQAQPSVVGVPLVPAKRAMTTVQVTGSTATLVTGAGVAGSVDDEAALAALAGASAQPASNTPPLAAEQLDDLRREYNGASEAQRQNLRAYFTDMGVDIKKLLARPGEAAAPDSQSLAQAIRAIEFTRTPQSVLAARSTIGFAPPPKPAATDFAATATWLQLQVFAGEWTALGDALRALPSADAIAAYTQILQTINRSQRGDPNRPADPALLPEEVLAIADAAPEELSDWQVTILAQLLKEAATKYSSAAMLQTLSADTRMFGKQDAAHRERTVKFLVAAGMALDAAEYFPDLAEARELSDAAALVNYGRYHEDFAASTRAGDDGSSHLRTAWSLYCEAALIGGAEASLRQAAMRRAIDLLPSMPPALASAWLKQIFANPTLAPAALEIIALKAVSIRGGSMASEARAQAILTMKESVDTLLAETGIDIRLVRVPLRMLTTALIGEVETALDGSADGNRRGRGQAMPHEMELLLRAMPSEQWMAALEPSLASRAYRAAIRLAVGADEIDVAIDSLAHAVKRFPEQAQPLANDLLTGWEKRLAPQSLYPDEDQMMFIGFARDGMTSAPLTRGRQRRNLDRLARLMFVLEDVGVDPRRLPAVAHVFHSCHGMTEVFTRAGITSVFGPLNTLAAVTAAGLADQMRSGLSGQWSDRKAQQAAGMKRSPEAITQLVTTGYALAIELIEQAIAQDPKSWRYAVTKAGLTYDRVQYIQDQKKQDFAAYNQFRKEAFEAFAQTAERYGEIVSAGDQRDDASVYLAWFSAAVGATELNYLTRDDLLIEGSPQDDQIDLIRKAIQKLPGDLAARHIAAFTHEINGTLNRLEPSVKPRIVKHAMRIIGDHPAGAALRRLTDLYQDLMRDEIKLRLTIDGDDRVGTRERFGATVTLRFTDEVDRETGGFSRYLQNDVWARVGNSYRPMNYRDLLKKSLESSFGEHFEVESVGFFEALAPPMPVREAGADGWLEKPVAYIVLKATDPSVDRIPEVSMDMHFNDTAGAVVLPVLSNAPQIDAAQSSGPRPVENLKVVQTVDLRDLDSSQKDHAVVLEVHADASGIVPELEALLPDFRTALAGYEVAKNGIEVRAASILENDTGTSGRSMYSWVPAPPSQYIEADASGTYRLPSERSWLITYTPTSAATGHAFTFPTLNAKLQGTLVSRQFSDMDIETVTTASVPIRPPVFSRTLIFSASGVAILAGFVFIAIRRRKSVASSDTETTLTRVTPMSVITALRRIESERASSLSANDHASLIAEITGLEEQYFGLHGAGADTAPRNGEAHAHLREALDRWGARTTTRTS